MVDITLTYNEQKIQEEFRKMKATGIVRRIDDLGRVVIPKEIRKTLRIKEGTPLEIFTDREGQIILKKYSPIGELNSFAVEYAEALVQTTGLTAWMKKYIRLFQRMSYMQEQVSRKLFIIPFTS